MMRSTEECEISRSCHRATFSKPAWALDRTTRARPLICSQVTGFRLCGIAEEPFCFSLKHSSASRTSVRCKCRIRSEEHTSELQSRGHLVCRLLLEKQKEPCRQAIWTE